VTLTGPGGCGKSRLAVEAARAAEDRFRDGVWCLDVAPIDDPGVLLSEVVGVFGIPEAAGRPAEEVLAEALAERELMLF
jgi:predicted ATPase